MLRFIVLCLLVIAHLLISLCWTVKHLLYSQSRYHNSHWCLSAKL